MMYYVWVKNHSLVVPDEAVGGEGQTDPAKLITHLPPAPPAQSSETACSLLDALFHDPGPEFSTIS